MSLTQFAFNQAAQSGNLFPSFLEGVTLSPAVTQQSAANEIHSTAALGWNEHGVAEDPILQVPYTSASGKVEATLFLALKSGQWHWGHQFAMRTKSGHGETHLPSIYAPSCRDFHEAYIQATHGLKASLLAKHANVVNPPMAEANEVQKLVAWCDQQEADAISKTIPNPAPLWGVKFIDLFSGIGGFRLGLESLGAECVLSCEKDKAAREAYALNFDVSHHPFPDDVTQLDAKDIPDFDILTAGFPCQSFSIAGKRQGTDDPRGKLIFELLRIIEAKRPKQVLLENVPNFLRIGDGKPAREVELALAQLGYSVTHKVMNAGHFGVPQLRERVYFVAVRKDAIQKGNVHFLFPQGDPTNIAKVADILVGDAPLGTIDLTRVVPKPSTSRALIHTYGYLDGRRSQDARVTLPDGPGPTLTTSETGCGRVAIKGKARSYLPRERARMMGFPGSTQLHSVKTHAIKQCGNAVVPPLIQAISMAVANQFTFN